MEKLMITDFEDICNKNGFSTFSFNSQELNNALSDTVEFKAEFNEFEIFVNPLGSFIRFKSNTSQLCFKWIRYIKFEKIDSDTGIFEFFCKELNEDFESKIVVRNIIASKN